MPPDRDSLPDQGGRPVLVRVSGVVRLPDGSTMQASEAITLISDEFSHLERENEALRSAEKRQCNRADEAEDYVNERDKTIVDLRAENERLREALHPDPQIRKACAELRGASDEEKAT